MLSYLLKEVLPTDELEILRVISHALFYAVSDGVLIRVSNGKELVDNVEGQKVHGPPIKRVYVPEGSRAHIVHAVHGELGHAGQTNTAEIVKSMFDWPTVRRDTVQLVKHCSNCQFHAPQAPSAPIQGHLRADHCGHVVAMDVLHLAKSTKCARYMLIVIDVFSRFAVGVILSDLKSETVARALRDDVLKHGWGRPDQWVCDGASDFKAELKAGITAWAALRAMAAVTRSQQTLF